MHHTTYSAVRAGDGGVLLSRFGRLARFAGSSEGPQVEYLTFAPADAGREVSMVDGGNGAKVIHLRPPLTDRGRHDRERARGDARRSSSAHAV